MPPSDSLSNLAAQFILVYVPEAQQKAAVDTLSSLLNLALFEGMAEGMKQTA